MGARDVLLTIEAWMAGLRRAVMTNRLKAGALAAFAGFVAVSLVIMTIEAVGHLSGTARAVLLALWALSALAALGLGLVWPILRYTLFAPSDKDLARAYAGRMPSVRDRVLNALQLLERAENAGREGYSQELILEAGREVAEDLQPVDPRTLPAREPVRLSGKLALISGAAAVILLLIAGRPLLSAAERVMKPGEEFEPPAPFTLAVRPGAAHLVRGDSLVVEVTATGAIPAAVIIERLETGKTATEPVDVKGEAGLYRYVYRGVTAPFTYWAHAGRVTSPEYEVEVEELPGIRFLSVRLNPPAYTKLEEQVLEENVGDIAAVVGTRVALQLAATKSLKEARLEFFSPRIDSLGRGEIVASPHGPLTRRAAKALELDGSRAQGSFTIEESGYYRVHLEDREGRTSRDPILYRITARSDEPPLVSITEPARDIDIAANVKVAVAAEAMDDFGFSKMALRYYRPSVGEPEELRGDDVQYKSVPLTWHQTEPGKAAAEYVWDLTPLDLLPEDEVLFFVEVWDNDAVHGPKRARSETRTLRFPSMAEIFDQQEQQAATREISLAELMQESQSVREEVEKAVEEFKSNPDMSWEKKQDLQKLLEKQQAMNDVLNQVAEAMQKAAEQMDERAMFSPEVMEKMQQIQELVQKVITPEMRKALEKLAKSMQQPSEEELRKALENFKMTQEMFERAVDQTLNMLKQLQMEQKLDELTRRLDELGRQQEQLNEKMDQNTPENAAKNSEQQQKLSEEMKKIEQEMRKLAEQMQQQPQQKGQEQMQALQKKMEQDQLSEQMQQNSGSMSMCQNQSAKKKGRQIRRDMAEMANMMQSLRQEMHQDQLAEVLAKLERARDQILDLSMRQEKLWKESENLEPGSPQMAEAAEEQANLRDALSRVGEDMQALARESMYVPPQLLGGMSRAMQQMDQAGAATQERDPRTAAHFRQQALGALNQTLKDANQSCSACKSACNKPNPNSMSSAAGQMAMQQQKLNGQTQQMGNTNPGSLSMGEQAAMQRLAAEQSGLAQAAQQLAQEAKASQQSLGDLGEVAKEMQEVAKDLEQRNISERTTEKQEHIESRLLDFQRANREREFSPKRQAHTGVDIVRSTPAPLPARPGQDQLREDLLRALDAKYTPDYEQLIRAYFDALSKWK